MLTLARLGIPALAIGLAAPSAAQEIVLAFDDLGVVEQQIGESYAAQGAHFALTDWGLEDGLGYTDSGGWGLEGTRGSWFEGFNGTPTYGMTVTFDAPVQGFALDVARSSGSADGDTFTLSGFRGVDLLETITIPLPAINTWATVALASSGIDRVEWSGDGAGFHPYGVDNIRFTVVPQVDRFKCYKAKDTKNPAPFGGAEVDLAGSLEDKLTAVRKPVSYCEAVDQDGAGFVNSDARLVCYQIKDAKTSPRQPKFQKQELGATDDFGALGLQLKKGTTLCVPAAEVP